MNKLNVEVLYEEVNHYSLVKYTLNGGDFFAIGIDELVGYDNIQEAIERYEGINNSLKNWMISQNIEIQEPEKYDYKKYGVSVYRESSQTPLGVRNYLHVITDISHFNSILEIHHHLSGVISELNFVKDHVIV